ncbi:MAG: hypothetical protein D084_Lepto4C00070G0003 [Leptospirillum sp. Group IV 'UBA BS']|nr:MAG: hypothetical protein D084_Lepto4C00070G0003 [Leptospirillum sp. Group IV 'UBA BS']MCL5284375.1 hypothetical protein [Nitrospirota bacterium]
MISPESGSRTESIILTHKGKVMFFWNRKKEDPRARVAPRRQAPTDKLLSLAYRIGKFSPTNCECPPAPSIIPVWIANNVETLELYVARLYSEFDIPRETEPALFLSMFEGFRDLIRSCPEAGDSPFCMSREEVIEVSKAIFVRLAEKRGILLDIPPSGDLSA